MGYTFVPIVAVFYELVARAIISFTLPVFIGYMDICVASLFAWFSATIPLYFSYKKKWILF